MRSVRHWTVWVMCVMCVGVPRAWGEVAAPETVVADPIDQIAERDNLHLIFAKFGRGVSNLFGGWLEVPLTIHKRFASSDAAGSLITGAAYGVVKGIVRTGVGLYETVTCLLPVPEDYAPILPTLDYFDSTKRLSLPLQ